MDKESLIKQIGANNKSLLCSGGKGDYNSRNFDLLLSYIFSLEKRIKELENLNIVYGK